MHAVIRIIRGDAELATVQRQRYATYVEAMGCSDRHADPGRAAIVEPLDDFGHIFGAFVEARLVASVRVNYGFAAVDGGFGEYAQLQAMHRFAPYFPYRVSMVTRLVIDPCHRSGTLLARLGVALYVYTRDTRPDTAFCLIDCVPRLKAMFLRLGYRQIGAPFDHPTVGPVLPMAFAVYDQEHFRRVRSPLAAVCPRHEKLEADWFESRFCNELRTYSIDTAEDAGNAHAYQSLPA